MVDDAKLPNPWFVFVTGALGLFACVQVLSPLAWITGNRYMRICLRQGLEPDPIARIGRVLGLVGTLLWVSLGLVWGGLMLYTYAFTR